MASVWILFAVANRTEFGRPGARVIGIYSSESAAKLARDKCREAAHRIDGRHNNRAHVRPCSSYDFEGDGFAIERHELDQTRIEHRVRVNADGEILEEHLEFGDAVSLNSYRATFDGVAATFEDALKAAREQAANV